MQDKKINIIHVRDSSGIYGAERVIMTLGNGLDKDLFDFKLLCMKRSDIRSYILADNANTMGIKTLFLPTKGKFDWSAIIEMRNIFDKHNIDIVHSHDFKSDLYALLASYGKNIKRISTAHGSTRDSVIKRIYLEFDEHVIYRKMDRIVAVSESVAADLKKKGLKASKICIIQNGFDVQLLKQVYKTNNNLKCLSIDSDKTVFSIVGRLFPDKGHRFFLRALARVIRDYPKVHVLIIGDGPDRETISKQIEALRLNNFVTLCGVVNNMQEVYERIDCIVISSITEGLPYVLLEAAANRVPVLATAVGDIPQLIEDGKTGYLVEPGNIAEIEDRLIRFLKREDNIKKMTDNCYKVFKKKFSADRMVAETENLYLSLFNMSRSPATQGEGIIP